MKKTLTPLSSDDEELKEIFKELIDEIAEKKKKAEEDTKGKQSGMSLEEYFSSFDNFLTDIVNDVGEKFQIVIGFTKKLSVDTSLKQFIVSSFDEMLQSLSDETSRTFNRSTFDIFTEMMDDLKSVLEEKLMSKIDSEFLNIKDGFAKFGNISEIMEDQFENIKGKIRFKTKYIPCQGKDILLLDDIFTTGATLNECTQVLNEHGADKVNCITIAID